MSQERLLLLQSLCGLSNGEAATLCGVGERAWNDFREGRKEPRDWGDLIGPLEDLRDLMNTQIARGVAAFKRAVAESPPEAEIAPPVFLLYGRDDDMPAGEAWPFATVQRRVTGEWIEALDIESMVVVFDRPDFDRWRGPKPDTRETRLEWAIDRVEGGGGLRYAINLFQTGSPVGEHAAGVGWAVYRLSAGAEKIAGGEIDE